MTPSISKEQSSTILHSPPPPHTLTLAKVRATSRDLGLLAAARLSMAGNPACLLTPLTHAGVPPQNTSRGCRGQQARAPSCSPPNHSHHLMHLCLAPYKARAPRNTANGPPLVQERPGFLMARALLKRFP